MSFFDGDPRRGADQRGGLGLGRINFSPEPLLGIVPFVVLDAAASADLTLTTAFQNVVGATVTLAHPGVWVISGVFDFDGAAGDTTGIGVLNIDGTNQAANALASLADTQRVTTGQTWVHRKTTLGPTVLQLQARKGGGAGASLVKQSHTTITASTVPGSETLPT